MKQAAPIVMLAVALLAMAVGASLWGSHGPTATDPSAEADASAELVGGFGDLSGGGGGGSSGSTPHVVPGVPLLDVGVHSVDAGEGAPEPLGSAPPPHLEPPAPLPASITFADPRTLEDEYDSATMVWSMIEMRREEVRTQLAEARRTGDQQLSARLAHQLELLQIGDRRMGGIVHELESRRAPSASPPEDTAHAEGSEGEAPAP